MYVSCDCCTCCQAETSVTGRSLVQRSPNDRSILNEGDLETTKIRTRRHTKAVELLNKIIIIFYYEI
jgi:hypothetical protein